MPPRPAVYVRSKDLEATSPTWPRFFDRNQAITALTVTELLQSGRDRSDPLVRALREEPR
jgi:hypothetical protein